ncbi:RNB domain-containing ribonuclease (plasmid) [Novosphingobium sp. BL-8A]|uniref:RNB domain-containing ribonuclease n=1 Tax=Novosphingobium sp. BL-8A TaxID=3127639 RepID=UPI00375821C4
MKVLADPERVLVDGLAAIRKQYAVPRDFPAPVVVEADNARSRLPTEHADWTDRAFATLDPCASTDLDQAFLLEPAGADLVLHYALADIGWFVPEGGALESEAWKRGVTLYLPDGKARLYPSALSEGAASLLPDGPRPAIVASIRCSPEGAVVLDGMTRAIVRSCHKLGYETTSVDEIPHLADFSERMRRSEDARAAARVDPPEQAVERDEHGNLCLTFRPWLASEIANSRLSLAANMAMAAALLKAETGLFREMPLPDERAVHSLRNTANGLGLVWPAAMSLAQFERSIDGTTRAGACFQLAVRRSTGRAQYLPFTAGHIPWHAALGATYTHATAPMRRLADRYVLEAALDVANGRCVSPRCIRAFEELPAIMNTADARQSTVERAVIDLAEASLLMGREGETFEATVTQLDEKGARIQLRDLPVLARVDSDNAYAGQNLTVRLVVADPERRELRFAAVNASSG